MYYFPQPYMRGLLDPVYANVGWTMEEAEPIDITWVIFVY